MVLNGEETSGEPSKERALSIRVFTVQSHRHEHNTEYESHGRRTLIAKIWPRVGSEFWVETFILIDRTDTVRASATAVVQHQRLQSVRQSRCVFCATTQCCVHSVMSFHNWQSVVFVKALYVLLFAEQKNRQTVGLNYSNDAIEQHLTLLLSDPRPRVTLLGECVVHSVLHNIQSIVCQLLHNLTMFSPLTNFLFLI